MKLYRSIVAALISLILLSGWTHGVSYIPAQGWGAVTKQQGVYAFPTGYTNGLSAYETWLGASVNHVNAFACGPNWPTIVTNVQAQIASLAPSNRPIYWGLCLPPGATMAALAAGAYNTYIDQIAVLWKAARPSDPIIAVRPFQEFNNPALDWTAVGIEPTWIAGFRLVTQRLLNTSTSFRIVWCANWTNDSYDLSLAWPGDAYVDVVAMDVYYISSFDGTDPNAAWALKQSSPYGLNWMTNFARTKSKPVAIPEWGIDSDTAAQYVSAFLDWTLANNVAYYDYYNANNGALFMNQIDTNAYPTTGARFIQEFRAPNKTNLFANPNTFTAADWQKTGSTITPGQPDPFGGTAASTMFETAATSNHLVTQPLAKSATTATFTGTRAGFVLTASVVVGTLHASDAVSWVGVADPPPKVKYQISGTPGGAGTYQLDQTGTVSSIAMVATPSYRWFIWAKPKNGRNFTNMQVGQNFFGSGTSLYANVSNAGIGSYFAYTNMGTPNPFCFAENAAYSRCGYEFSSTSDTTLLPIIAAAPSDGVNSYLGDITKGLDIYTGWLRQIN